MAIGSRLIVLGRLIGVGAIVSAVVTGVLALNLWLFAGTPYGRTAQTVTVPIGTSVSEVTERLEEIGVVSNALMLKAYILVKGAASKVRAGEYYFQAGIRPREILSLLVTGDFTRHRITLPEGWTVRQIADYLGSKGLVQSAVFIAKSSDPQFIEGLGLQVPSLEGYLFPDTYEIYKPKDEEEVLKKLVDRFREVVPPEFAGRDPRVTLTDEQVVILASIVERETGRPEERGIIASVFLNRLARGMALASDPTVIYGLPSFSGNLTREDLERPGPYNTYLNPGLPPTPISNPGLESIRAVLHPAETDFLYFVSRGDGSHQFSRTEAEHQRAVAIYQVRGNRQAGGRP